MINHELNAIRQGIRKIRGKRVILNATGGRKKSLNVQGILDGAYPDIFTVVVEEEGFSRRLCYTYAEVLSGNVRLALRPDRKIQQLKLQQDRQG